jgi:hypothetical protein
MGTAEMFDSERRTAEHALAGLKPCMSSKSKERMACVHARMSRSHPRGDTAKVQSSVRVICARSIICIAKRLLIGLLIFLP